MEMVLHLHNFHEDDDSMYREEAKELASWNRDNNIKLNLDETNDVEHTPLSISNCAVERVDSITFLGVQISDDYWDPKTSPTENTLCKKSETNITHYQHLSMVL
ncbi:hypothetical protein CHARACLAT_005358 [Characodon lateralis]|uniref:Uncharacterized protein n=1 Tax=Characodon lateralis TaxID=208331 RepID=A0ABU7CXY9_9TELE|nr:hypothetical protein [Characodon lateralis]